AHQLHTPYIFEKNVAGVAKSWYMRCMYSRLLNLVNKSVFEILSFRFDITGGGLTEHFKSFAHTRYCSSVVCSATQAIFLFTTCDERFNLYGTGLASNVNTTDTFGTV